MTEYDEDGIGLFDQNNPTEWGVVLTGYDLAGFVLVGPVALQVFHKDGRRTIVTGVLTSTEDTYADTEPTSRPTESMFFFQHADVLTIDWSKTGAIMAMVAIPVDESGGETNG